MAILEMNNKYLFSDGPGLGRSRKRQRTGAVHDASRLPGTLGLAPAFGLRQSSGVFGRLPLSNAFTLLAAMVLAGCAKEQASQAPEPPPPKIEGETISFPTNAPQLATISVATAEPQKFAVTHVTGRLYWNDERTVRVFTPVAGRVTSVLAVIGQDVSTATPLAQIDSPDFGQALAAARTAAGNFAAADKALARN